MKFVKLHGYGNDYLVFEAEQFAFEAGQLAPAGWRAKEGPVCTLADP